MIDRKLIVRKPPTKKTTYQKRKRRKPSTRESLGQCSPSTTTEAAGSSSQTPTTACLFPFHSFNHRCRFQVRPHGTQLLRDRVHGLHGHHKPQPSVILRVGQQQHWQSGTQWTFMVPSLFTFVCDINVILNEHIYVNDRLPPGWNRLFHGLVDNPLRDKHQRPLCSKWNPCCLRRQVPSFFNDHPRF